MLQESKKVLIINRIKNLNFGDVYFQNTDSLKNHIIINIIDDDDDDIINKEEYKNNYNNLEKIDLMHKIIKPYYKFEIFDDVIDNEFKNIKLLCFKQIELIDKLQKALLIVNINKLNIGVIENITHGIFENYIILNVGDNMNNVLNEYNEIIKPAINKFIYKN